MKAGLWRMLVVVLLGSVIPSGLQAAELKDIVNFHSIDSDLITAGQVLPEHIAALDEAKVELVVNLAVASLERNSQEGFLLTNEGINYVQIPVVWDKPTAADLQLFYAVMEGRGERKTLVHCFANYRASAFTYLYRVTRLGVDEAEARKDLEIVWSEEAFVDAPQWRKFIDTHLSDL
ncbi:MAG: protein tyrosine phosphatase (PTP) superfamily phosphohydrolase (DUF442 family) [Patiriisocius sp.]|jgi:protein tyrosine phosphatase (PTP) superfamily phosphohydrolase (DUF442 family)